MAARGERSAAGSVRLVHWNADEAAPRVEALREAGWVVRYAAPDDAPSMTGWRADAPAALVVDLSRLPSHGASIAMMVRVSKWGRRIPLVFVGGAPEKVAAVRAKLPDATYTTWPRVRGALRAALANPVDAPMVPTSRISTGAPLATKLGVREGTVLRAVDAPGSFEDLLGDLPPRASVRHEGSGDVVVWFVRSADDVALDVEGVLRVAGAAPLWIAWPKRSAGVEADVTQADVIAAGRSSGRADAKICSVDATWSAMCFVVPAARRGARSSPR